MKKANSKRAGKSTSRKGRDSVRSRIDVEEDDMLDDYGFLDWSKAERGKYAKRYAEGTNIVMIEPDLTDLFPDSESVNRALRALADIIRNQKRIAPEKTR